MILWTTPVFRKRITYQTERFGTTKIQRVIVQKGLLALALRLVLYVRHTVKQPAACASSQSLPQLCCIQFFLIFLRHFCQSVCQLCNHVWFAFFFTPKAPIFDDSESLGPRTINTLSVRFPFQCPISYTTDHNKSRTKTQNKNSAHWFVFAVDYCVYVIHIDHSTVIFMYKYRAVYSVQGVWQACSYCTLRGAVCPSSCQRRQSMSSCLSVCPSVSRHLILQLSLFGHFRSLMTGFIKICWRNQSSLENRAK